VKCVYHSFICVLLLRVVRKRCKNLQLWLSRVDLGFTVTFVGTSQDPEETVDTPVLSPRVGNNPVWQVGSRVNTPANILDSVTTSQTTGQMSVDTRAIGEEILVDAEAHLDGSVGHDVLLDSFKVVRVKELNGGSISLVQGDGRSVSTLGWARWNVSTARCVWNTLVRGGTSGCQELPFVAQIASVAAIVGGVTGNNVLWGHFDVDGSVGSNAESVSQNFSSGEGPA